MIFMDDSKVLVYRHPNPEMRSFLVGEEISSFRVEHFKQPLSEDSGDALKSLGRIGEKLVKEIMLLPQIKELSIKPHELLIKKEASASWEILEEKVLVMIHRALKRKKMRIV
jgi:hypothetical protein